jgi:regulator of sigma E protease
MVNPPAYNEIAAKDRKSKIDHVLVAAGPAGKEPTPLVDVSQYDRLLAQYADQPITHVIERRPAAAYGASAAVSDRFELTVPPNHVVDFGLRLEIEPISGIRKDSPADKAGFRKGDRIVRVNGQDDFDLMRLPGMCFANAGKPMTFEVEREAGNGQRRTLTLSVTPNDTPPRTEIAAEKEPVDVSGLGLCYPVGSRVVAVRPDSPASKAGLKPGDVLNKLVIPPAKPQAPARGFFAWLRSLFNWNKGEEFEFNEKSPEWFAAFVYLQNRPVQEVKLVVNNASEPIAIKPEPDPTWYNPARGLQFFSRVRTLPAQSFAAALRSGYDLTVQNILMVYATFRSLAERRVSPKHLGGPIMIAQVAYAAAGSGFADLIHFLGFLSINLAVLNFLPIPPLDGGQMLFLIAEKVRGRPLPDSALIAGTYLGLIFVLGLMVFVTYQDVFRLFTG